MKEAIQILAGLAILILTSRVFWGLVFTAVLFAGLFSRKKD